MQNLPIRSILCLTGAILLAACTPPTEDPADVDPFERIAGATIDGIMDQPITLTGGAWLGEPYVEGAASRAGVVLLAEPIAVGDLDDDTDDEIVAVLVLNKGGSGAFVYLVVIEIGDGDARSLATLMLGDRVQVRALSTNGRRIIVEATEHGPDDAMCCPTDERQRSYVLHEGDLLASDAEFAPTAQPRRFHGHVSIGHEVRSLTSCGSDREAWLFDLTDGDLVSAYEQLLTAPYEPLFVEVLGYTRAAPDSGFAADYAEAIAVVELRRAEREGFGCDEDLAGAQYRARGNEPSWRLDIRADELVLTTMDAGEIAYTIEKRTDSPGETTISGTAGDSRIDASLIEQRCIDSMSGSWFPFAATISTNGTQLRGCALEGK